MEIIQHTRGHTVRLKERDRGRRRDTEREVLLLLGLEFHGLTLYQWLENQESENFKPKNGKKKWVAQMVSYQNQPRSLKQRCLSGVVVWLARYLFEIIFFEENASLKWMPHQSKLKSGPCMTHRLDGLSEPGDLVWDKYSQSSQSADALQVLSLSAKRKFSRPKSSEQANSPAGFLLRKLCMEWTQPGIGSPGPRFCLCLHPFHLWPVPRASLSSTSRSCSSSSHGSTFPTSILSPQQKGIHECSLASNPLWPHGQ